MAHCKGIVKRPFKPVDIDFGVEKNEVTIITNKETNHDIAESHPIKSSDSNYNNDSLLQHLDPSSPIAQSISASVTSAWPVPESLAPKKNVAANRQLADIPEPHEHDVLCGRGNYVNYHSGNQYYRNLVKKYFLQYVSASKNEKPRYAQLIYHEVGMRDPPGRFLRQDLDTKLWHDVGEKKALDKTRQALREGAPEVRSRVKYRLIDSPHQISEERTNVLGETGDAHSLPSARRPSSVTNSPTATVADYIGSTPMEDHMRPLPSQTKQHRQTSHTQLRHQLNNQAPPSHALSSKNNAGTSERAQEDTSRNPVTSHDYQTPNRSIFTANGALDNESLANSVASRLLSSNYNALANENITNLVSLGILSLVNGKSHLNHSMQNGSLLNMNAMTGEPFLARNPVVQKTGNSSNEPLARRVTADFDQTQKRQGIYSNGSDYNKRQKIDGSFHQPSIEKDAVGATALLGLSKVVQPADDVRVSCGEDGNDEIMSLENKHEDICNVIDTASLKTSSTQPGNDNENKMDQKSNNVGSGNSVSQTSALLSCNKTSRDSFPPFVSLPGSFLDKEIRDTSKTKPDQQSGKKSNSNELLEVSSIWDNRIRQAEEKWGIAPGNSKNFSHRIDAIEKKALECRKLISNATTHIHEKGTAKDSVNENEGLNVLYVKLVERAEEQWGIVPSDGWNLTERVGMIEQTAQRCIKRLQNWI